MPFVRNAVKPVHVRRGALARAGVTLGGEHEAAVNGSLARAMEQIADLSLIADRLFRELLLECVAALDRAERLSCRTRRLQDVADRLELAAADGEGKHETACGSSCWSDRGTVVAIAYEQETGLFTPATRPECVVHLYRSLSVQQPVAEAGAEASFGNDKDAAGMAVHLSGFSLRDMPESGGDNVAAALGRISMQPVFMKGGPTVVERDLLKATAHRLQPPRTPRQRRTLETQQITRTRYQASSEPAVLASEEQLRRCTLPTPEQRQALAIGLLPAPEVVAISVSRSAACSSMQQHRSKMAQLRGRQRDLLWLPVSKEGWHYQTLPARRWQAVDYGEHDQAGHAQIRKQQLPSLLGVVDGLRIPPLALLRGVDLQPSLVVLAKDPSAYLYETDADSSTDVARDRTTHSQQQQQQRLADGRDGRAGSSHGRSRSSMRRSQLIGRLRRSLSLPKGFERQTRSPSRHRHDVGSAAAAAMTASDFAGRSRSDTQWQAVSAPVPCALIDDRSELVYVNFYGAPNTDASVDHSAVSPHSRGNCIKHSHSEHGRLGHSRPSMSESISAAASDRHGSLLQGLPLRSRSHGQIDQCFVGGVSGGPQSSSGAKGSILSKGLRPKSLSADRLHGLLVVPGGASSVRAGGGGSSKLGSGASRLSRTLSGFFRRKQATATATAPSKQQHGSHGGLPAAVSVVASYDDDGGCKGKSKSRNRLSQLLAGMGIAGNGPGGGVLLRKRDSKATSSSSGRWSGSERYSVGSDAGGCCQASTTLSQSRMSKLSGDRDSAVSEGSLTRGDHPFDALSFGGGAPAATAVGECPSLLGTFSSANRSSCADFNFGVSGHVQPSSHQPLQPAAHAAALDVPGTATPSAVQQLPAAAATNRSADVAESSRNCRHCCGASSDPVPETPSATYLGRCPDVVSDEDWGRCISACVDAQTPADGRCYREAGPTVACDHPSHIANCSQQSSSSSSFSRGSPFSRSARAAGPPQQQTAVRDCRETTTAAAADSYCTLPRPGRFRLTSNLCERNGDVAIDRAVTRRNEMAGDRGAHDYRSLPRRLSSNRVVHFGATGGESGVGHGHGRQQLQQQQRQLNAQGISSAQAAPEAPAAAAAHASATAAALQSPADTADTAASSSSKLLKTSETEPNDEDDSVAATTVALPDVPAMPEVVPPPVLCSLVSPLGQSRCHELRRASYRRSLSPGTLETSVTTRLPAGDSALVSSLIQEARSMSAVAASSTTMSPTSPQQLAAAVEPSSCSVSVQNEHHAEASGGCFVRRASYRVAVTKVHNAASGVQQQCCSGTGGGSSVDMGSSSLAVSSSKRSSLIACRLADEPVATVDATSDLSAEEFPFVDGVYPVGPPCDDCEDAADDSDSFIRSYSYRLANRSSVRHRKRVIAPALPSLAARRSLLLFETDCEQTLSPQSPPTCAAVASRPEMPRVSGDAQNSFAHFAARSPSVVTAATTTTTTLDWSMLPSVDSTGAGSGGGSGDACLEIACRVRFTGRLGSAFSSTGISSSLSHLNALVSADGAQAGADESDRAPRLSSSAVGAAAASPSRVGRERPRSTFFPKGDVSAEIMHGLLALQHRCHDGAAAAAFTSLEMLRQDERMLLSLMDVVATSPPSPSISSNDLSAAESDPVG